MSVISKKRQISAGYDLEDLNSEDQFKCALNSFVGGVLVGQ